MRKTWTTTEIDELLALYKGGFSAHAIAGILNRSLNSVNRALTRHQIRGLKDGPSKKHFRVTVPTVYLGGTPLHPQDFKKVDRSPLVVSSGFRETSILPLQSAGEQKSLKIPIKATPPARKPQTLSFGPLEEAVAWAHTETSLRVLPIQKDRGVLFYYVRNLEDLTEKSYVTTGDLFERINRLRLKRGLPLFALL